MSKKKKDDLKNEGTLAFFLQHNNTDWPIDGKPHSFPTATHQGISVSVSKAANGILEINLRGALGKDFTFRRPCPLPNEKGVHLAITWSALQVELYLNGKSVETVRIGGDPSLN